MAEDRQEEATGAPAAPEALPASMPDAPADASSASVPDSLAGASPASVADAPDAPADASPTPARHARGDASPEVAGDAERMRGLQGPEPERHPDALARGADDRRGSGAAPVPAAPAPSGRRPRVRGRVAGLVKGGFEVDVDGTTAFCSLGHMDLARIADPSSFLGRELAFEVLAVPPGSVPGPARTRLSRRRILEEEAREATRATRSRLAPGARVHGRVTRIADFGVFVDLGGVEGLVPTSEISHRRFERASDFLFVGQELELSVLRGGESSGRVSLSLKATEEDPWARASERWQRWQVADGRLLRVTDFGAFFELEPGVEGLLHASELPPGALERLEEASRGGAVMSVLILGVDGARRRISLGAAPKGLEPGEKVEPVSLRVGAVVTGRVEEIDANGVVVRLGPGQVGFIPHPDMGTPRGADHRAEFPRGTEIEAEVIRVEGGGRRARLSRKRALRRAERAEVERYNREQVGGSLSTFGDLLAQAREKQKR